MFIYAIGTETRQKIGISKNPHKRLKQLQTGNAEQLVLHHMIEVHDDRTRLLERFLHKDIGYKKLKGEWFNLTKQEAKDYLTFAEITWVNDPLLSLKL